MELLHTFAVKRLLYRTLYADRGLLAAPPLRRLAFRLLDTNPRTFKLHLNATCNLSCRNCYATGKPDELDGELITRLLEQIRTPHSRLDLLGGEPLLHPELLRIVARAQDNRCISKVYLYTNGTLVTDRAATELHRAGLHTAIVSLHSHRAETHEQLTRTPGSFAETVAGIRRLVAAGIRTYLFSVVCALNADDLAPLADLARELGVRPLYLPYIAQREDDELSLRDPQRFAAAMAWIIDHSPVFARSCAKARHDGSTLCLAFTDTVSIRADGEVTPCPFVDIELGNIRERALYDILHDAWQSRELQQLLSLPAECADCSLASLCGGGCKAGRYTVHGDAHSRDPHCRGPWSDPIARGELCRRLPYLH